ncbi:MAG: glycosyltransferase family protein [Azoarcus sp.]|jgi:hypothetical protein|nr:glycosyltransferase family protein [Azoarcus sp.]
MNASRRPFFTVAICSIDAWRFAQASECYKALLRDFPHEIVGIHDARSLAEGYNRALRRARGDIVVFSHDDVLILDPAFASKIARRLADGAFDMLGFVGTTRLVNDAWWGAGGNWLNGAVCHYHTKKMTLNVWNTDPWPVVGGIQAIDGLCMMSRRDTAEEIGFDEETFDGFHLYDLDFSYSAWRAGKKIGVCCDIPVIHASAGRYDRVHEAFGRRFLAKHRDALPSDAQAVPRIAGPVGVFSTDRIMLESWRQDVFHRASFALRRQVEARTGDVAGSPMLPR